MAELQFYKIESIKKNVTQKVYDISVKNNSNFIANNMVIHNCYEEQIMAIGREIGKFDPSQLNRFRKFLKEGQKIIVDDKKKYNKLKKEFYDQFISNGIAQDLDKEELEKLWQLMVKFSLYSFNECLDGECLIELIDGSKKVLKDIEIGEIIKCSSGYYFVKNKYENGIKECVEITTESGKKIVCTLDHKLRTENGMMKLKDILKQNLTILVNECI